MLNYRKNYKYIIAIILFLIVVSVVLAYQYKDTFGNVSTGTIKDLQIMLFTSSECKHCNDQIKALGSYMKDIEVRDLSVPENQVLAKQLGIIGTPFFVSVKNRSGYTGYEPEVSKLVKYLSPDKVGPAGPSGQAEQTGPVGQASVVLISKDGCGHCTKAKANIDALKLPSSVIRVINSGSKEASDIIKKFNLEIKGYPTFVNINTGKIVVGFNPPVTNIIKELTA